MVPGARMSELNDFSAGLDFPEPMALPWAGAQTLVNNTASGTEHFKLDDMDAFELSFDLVSINAAHAAQPERFIPAHPTWFYHLQETAYHQMNSHVTLGFLFPVVIIGFFELVYHFGNNVWDTFNPFTTSGMLIRERMCRPYLTWNLHLAAFGMLMVLHYAEHYRLNVGVLGFVAAVSADPVLFAPYLAIVVSWFSDYLIRDAALIVGIILFSRVARTPAEFKVWFPVSRFWAPVVLEEVVRAQLWNPYLLGVAEFLVGPLTKARLPALVFHSLLSSPFVTDMGWAEKIGWHFLFNLAVSPAGRNYLRRHDLIRRWFPASLFEQTITRSSFYDWRSSEYLLQAVIESYLPRLKMTPLEIVQFGNWAAGLLTCRSISAIFIHLNNWALTQVTSLSMYASRMCDLVEKFVAYFKSIIPFVKEGASDVIDHAIDYLEEFTNSPLMNWMRVLVSGAIMMPAFAASGLPFYADRLGLLDKKLEHKANHDGISFLVAVCRSIKGFFDFGVGVLSGRQSIREALRESSPYSTFIDESFYLEKLQHFCTTAESVEGKTINDREFRTRLVALIADGQRLHHLLRREPGVSAAITRRLAVLNSIESKLLARDLASDKPAAFISVVKAAPGVGKSVFTTMCQIQFEVARGRKYNPAAFTSYAPGANFQDQITNGIIGIHFDELGVETDEVLKSNSSESIIKKLLHYGDSMPIVEDRSAVEDKGKTLNRAELITASTNTFDIKARLFSDYPAAVYRRLVWWEIEVRPEFRSEAGIRPDTSKLEQLSDGDRLDIYQIRQVFFNTETEGKMATDRQGSYPHTTSPWMTVGEWCDVYQGLVKAHFRKQEIRKEAVDYAMNSICPHGKWSSVCLPCRAESAHKFEGCAMSRPQEMPPIADTQTDCSELVCEHGCFTISCMVCTIGDNKVTTGSADPLLREGFCSDLKAELMTVAELEKWKWHCRFHYWRSWWMLRLFMMRVVWYAILPYIFASSRLGNLGVTMVVEVLSRGLGTYGALLKDHEGWKARIQGMRGDSFSSACMDGFLRLRTQYSNKVIDSLRVIFGFLAVMVTGGLIYNVVVGFIASKKVELKREGNLTLSVAKPTTKETLERELHEMGVSTARLVPQKGVKRAEFFNPAIGFDHNFVTDLPRATLAERRRQISAAVYYVGRADEGFVPKRPVGRAFGIKPGFVILNEHVLNNFRTRGILCLYKLSSMDEDEPRIVQRYTVQLRNGKGEPFFSKAADDCVVLRAPGVQCADFVSTALSSHPSETRWFKDAIAHPGYLFCGHEVADVSCTLRKNQEVEGDVIALGYSYALELHSSGICGSPLFLQFGDRAAFGGIHAAGSAASTVCLAATFLRSELEKAISVIPEYLEDLAFEGFLPPLKIDGQEPVIGAPDTRSFLNWQSGNVQYLGTIKNLTYHRPKPKMAFLPTAPYVQDVLGLQNRYDADHYLWGVPDFREYADETQQIGFYSPYHKWAEKAFQAPHFTDERFLEVAVDSFWDRITSRLSSFDAHPLDLVSVVSGDCENRSIRAMNLASSMGVGFQKVKREHTFPFPTEQAPDGKMFTDEVLGEVRRTLEAYSLGMTARPINNASLKVETRPITETPKGLVIKQPRVFCATQCADTIVGRMFLLPLLEIVKAHLDVFECTVGVNAASLEWGAIRKRFEHVLHQSFGADISGFDTRMPLLVKRAAMTILIRMAGKAGYSPSEITILRGYLTDSVFPHVLVKNDLLMMPNLNVSGRVGTAEFNSLCLSIIYRMVYYRLHPDLDTAKLAHSFESDIVLITYGDDSKAGSKVDWFNQTSFCEGCAYFGIIATNPSKSTEVVKFVPFDEEEFLHRTWRFDQEYQVWCAPLALSSLARSLTLNVRSSIGVELQTLEAMTSVNWELAQHGRPLFDEMMPKLEHLFVVSGLEKYGKFVRRSFDDIMESCYRTSLGNNIIKNESTIL